MKLRVKSLIAKYDGRGYTQTMIVGLLKRELGVDISQPMVGIYKRQVWQELARDYKHNRDEAKAQKLEQLRDVRREAWDAWVRSSEDARKTVEEYSQGKEQVSPDDYITSEELVKRVETREGRLPDCAYLNTIRQTLKDERDLLGLDEQREGMVTMAQAVEVINAIKDAVREVLADHPDLWRLVHARTVALAPRAIEGEVRK